MTKRYLVALSRISTAPLGHIPPAGGRQEDFDELPKARAFAESMKDEWNSVDIYDRAGKDRLERIEKYRDGRMYPG